MRKHKCASGLTGWEGKLRDQYKSFEEFESYSQINGLAKKLGFDSAEDAWDENPNVHGSIEPSDYGIHTFPDCYLHVRECRSGEEWIRPMRGNSSLDLATQIRKWVKEEFAGELFLEGKIQPKLDGDYYGQIITDGRSPEDGICWTGGGFWLTDEPNAVLRNK